MAKSVFPRKKCPRPVVLVRWLDAYTKDERYDDTDTSHITAPTCTVGFLVRQDREGITLTTDVELPDPGDPDSGLSYRGKHFVPHGMIVDVTILRQ